MMAHALTTTDGWAGRLALATPHGTAPLDSAGLSRLPGEWATVDRVVVEDIVIDHVVVGPNGVFTVVIDSDRRPATIRPDGLYRNTERVTTTVKNAAMAAHALRRLSHYRMFAYPMLISAIEGSQEYLDRLGVVPGGRIPEAIWSHPGTPLRRSQRLEHIWSLRSLTE